MQSPEQVFETLADNWMVGADYGPDYIEKNWPQEILAALLKEGFLKLRQDANLKRHYETRYDSVPAFVSGYLRRTGKSKTLEPGRFWDLGNQKPFGQAYLIRGIWEEKWPDAPRVFAGVTEKTTGLCIVMDDWNVPDWMPKSLCYCYLHEQLRFTSHTLWMETGNLEKLVSLQEKKNVQWREEHDDRPPKINLSGNLALKDHALIGVWRIYLARFKTAKKIEIIEKETVDLDWSQNQRAMFIGIDKALYSRKKPRGDDGSSPVFAKISGGN